MEIRLFGSLMVIIVTKMHTKLFDKMWMKGLNRLLTNVVTV